MFEKYGYVADHPWFRAPLEPLVKHIILLGVRRKLVIKAKGFFMKAIIYYARQLPEPRRSNTIKANTHHLLNLRDEFFELNPLVPKRNMVESALKILIDEYEHNEEYEPLYDDIVQLIKQKNWFFRRRKNADTPC